MAGHIAHSKQKSYFRSRILLGFERYHGRSHLLSDEAEVTLCGEATKPNPEYEFHQKVGFISAPSRYIGFEKVNKIHKENIKIIGPTWYNLNIKRGYSKAWQLGRHIALISLDLMGNVNELPLLKSRSFSGHRPNLLNLKER